MVSDRSVYARLRYVNLDITSVCANKRSCAQFREVTEIYGHLNMFRQNFWNFNFLSLISTLLSL